MTDSEIIEALSCCIKYDRCDKCQMYEKCEFSYDRDYVGVPDILPLSLDLIKQQKAKIDKLEHDRKS